jgi:hypothetical protein
VIVLSDEFYREILSHPIPTDLEAAKALSSSLAALDLFMWLSYRCFTARGRERVPSLEILGSGGSWAVQTMRDLESSAKNWRAGWIWFVRCGRHVRPQLIRKAPGYLWIGRMRLTEVRTCGTSQRAGIWRL